MSLYDAAEGKDAGPAMVKVSVGKMDTLHAATMVLKAIKSADASALCDALELFVAACEDSGGDDEAAEGE